MKYHVENGCGRNRIEHGTASPIVRLTRAQFLNTLSNQRCRTCWRMTAGEAAMRSAQVAAGELIEAKPGETMRLTRGTAEVIRKLDYEAHCATNPADRISIRANTRNDRVMLTAHETTPLQTRKIACIDLTPDAADAFAAKLIEAAKLARDAIRPDALPELWRYGDEQRL